jgi:hypothetical protein
VFEAVVPETGVFEAGVFEAGVPEAGPEGRELTVSIESPRRATWAPSDGVCHRRRVFVTSIVTVLRGEPLREGQQPVRAR